MMMDFSQDPAVRRPKAHEAHNRMAGRNAGELTQYCQHLLLYTIPL